MKRLTTLLLSLASACAPTPSTPDATPQDRVDAGVWEPPSIPPPDDAARVIFEPLGDLNQAPLPLSAATFMPFGDEVVFGARAAVDGYGLYVSDGTSAGTRLVHRSTSVGTLPTARLVHGGLVYFSSSEEGSGSELWVTDGRPQGTRLLVDASPGPRNGFSNMVGVMNDHVYWMSGTTLWRTDGTPEGTGPVGEIPIRTNGFVTSFAILGQRIVFAAALDDAGLELWATDGTPAGTHRVADINPGPVGIGTGNFIALDEHRAVFMATDGAHGLEPWVTDGTPTGTLLLRDIAPGTTGSTNGLQRLVGSDGFAWFVAGDGVTAPQVWRTDGTVLGTRQVTNLTPTAPTDAPVIYAGDGHQIFFGADDGVHGREPWVSDGTEAGTRLLADVTPGAASSTLSSAARLGQGYVFSASDGTHGTELWRSDDTARGAHLVVDLLPGDATGVSGQLSTVGGLVFFSGTTPDVTSAPFASDGISATPLLKPIEGATNGSDPRGFTWVGEKLFFTATDAEHGRELWVRDEAGVRRLSDANPGPGDGAGVIVVAGGPRVYFGGTDPAHGHELWTSDGTAAGTHLLRDIMPGPGSGLLASSMVWFDGRLFFTGDDGGPAGRDLWTSDGTTQGTGLVADINPEPAASGIGFLPAGDMLLFNFSDAQYEGLFRVDTRTGTIARLTPRALMATSVSTIGGRVYLTLTWPLGRSPGGPDGLWTTDGTPTGTRSLIPGFRAAGIEDLDGRIVLAAGDAIYRLDDGATPVLVADVDAPQYTNETRSPFVKLGGALYFVGGNGTRGRGLWRTDGTTAGTSLVAPLAGIGIAAETPPVRVGQQFVFLAGDATHGKELWLSDGTSRGTRMVRDVYPGVMSSRPSFITGDGARLVMSINDGLHGQEPWELTLP